MGKIKTNQKFRIIAKALQDIDKAKEIFIEACSDKQHHNQMIKYPLAEYSSVDNRIFISTLDDFGDYDLDLNNLYRIEYDRDSDHFNYWLIFINNIKIHITNEW